MDICGLLSCTERIVPAIISAAVSIRWMIEHDFEVPTDADLRQMEVEVNRELCDAWVEIYVLALREWLDGQ